MLRGWGLLCKFMYFRTNAVVAEYFSLAWSTKQAQGYNWGQLGLFLQTLFSGGSPRLLLANDQHWEMLRQTKKKLQIAVEWPQMAGSRNIIYVCKEIQTMES